MTRPLTILVLACVLVGAVAAAAILGRDGVLRTLFDGFATSAEIAAGPVANRQGKKDRLPIADALQASLEQPPAVPALTDPLRQAFAAESPITVPPPSMAAPIVIPSQQPTKPKLLAKPAPQKTYTLLSDMQIAALKGRLNLTSSQEQHWPSVENALRAIARKIHETRGTGSPQIDPSSAEVQQLKSAAMPLLVQLREDQKREVRSLARIIGLERIASQI